jgi:hypothetical protein
MSFLQSITHINNNTEHKLNFEHFVRVITTREPGTVPLGDIFTDREGNVVISVA